VTFRRRVIPTNGLRRRGNSAPAPKSLRIYAEVAAKGDFCNALRVSVRRFGIKSQAVWLRRTETAIGAPREGGSNEQGREWTPQLGYNASNVHTYATLQQCELSV